MKARLFLFMMALTVGDIYAQDASRGLASQLGIGMADVAPQAQAASVFTNPAGLAGIPSLEATFGLGVAYNMLQMRSQSVSLAGNGWGIGLSQWGTPFFSRFSLGAAVAGRMGHVAYGIRAMAYQWKAEFLPTRYRIGFDAGVVVPLAERLRLGAWMGQLSWGKQQSWMLYQMPLSWQVGLAGEAHSKVGWTASLQMQSMQHIRWQAGLRYLYAPKLHLLVGVSSAPYQLHAGLLYSAGRISAGYAASRHAQLGASQAVTMGWRKGKHGNTPSR